MQIPQNRIGAVLCVIALSLLGGLAYRMTLGVDLSDESYYLTFLHDWLDHGLSGSKTLVIHQTAELLVLPLAKAYATVSGGETGLNLFLRFVFLGMAGVAGFSQYRWMLKMRDRATAALSGCIVLCFIPFNLPAPSYNTIGMFAMVCALSLFGIAMIEASFAAMLLSGVAWAIAVIAYPPLAAVLVALIGVAARTFRKRPEWSSVVRYGVICAALQVIGGGIVVGVYGWARLAEILRFSNASMNVSVGVWLKAGRSVELLRGRPGFVVLLALSAAGGLLGGRREVLPGLLLACVLLAKCFTEPVLYLREHDIILLLAVSGFLVLPPMAGIDPAARLIYGTSLGAGIFVAALATNGIFNFPIGALTAAAMGPAFLLPRDATQTARSTVHAAMMLATLLLLGNSFLDIYGEAVQPFRTASTRVRTGIFAGLLTTREKAAFLDGATRFLSEEAAGARTIVVLGRLPGVYLLTPLSPSTPSTWNFSQFYGDLPAADSMMREFYRDPKNRPDVVVTVRDPWTNPLGSAAQQLLSGYRLTKRFESGDYSMALYR